MTDKKNPRYQAILIIAASGEGGVEAVYADEDVWLSQKMMVVLYDVTIVCH